ncbi:HalOD1 output domain-containing protein [Natronolimnohabitans sp. A-GB9]|uniref:HalOD1 output domain-containing protein n=1 Tax=Natronolimnohabitans sp. A-GB9 TaxID=3069757 RepID=UPI0027B4DD4C|nr:HalOD1 output domain-containing protein [Natronolimnohabitans sp. A-GB9]MDQ2050038.1 HalOD1 output domain-containing protein [Natronolimnohabitans sp. A-GB9]
MSKTSSSPELSARTPSLAVIEQIAALEDTDPMSLPPLYDAVDPEALDSLCHSPTAGQTRTATEVRFTYCGYDVRVGTDGDVEISEA